MRTIGNILWFIFGGLLGGLAWVFAGCIWCITIIGIPVGLQCFKFATLAFWPFGKQIGMAVPVQGAKIILEAVLKTLAGDDYPHIEPSDGIYKANTLEDVVPE